MKKLTKFAALIAAVFGVAARLKWRTSQMLDLRICLIV